MLGTGNVHPRTGYEGFEGEYGHSTTLSLNSVPDRGWMVNAMPWLLYPGKETQTPLCRSVGRP